MELGEGLPLQQEGAAEGLYGVREREAGCGEGDQGLVIEEVFVRGGGGWVVSAHGVVLGEEVGADLMVELDWEGFETARDGHIGIIRCLLFGTQYYIECEL